MKKIGLLLLIYFFSLSTYGQKNTVWQIGTQDSSAAEFALAPAGKGSFLADFGGENTVFSIGYSNPQKHWPYVLPGPLDSWAGGGYWSGFYPRHFPRIVFNLKNQVSKSIAKLIIDFADVNAEKSTVLRVEINGHRQELTIAAGKGKALDGNYSAGKKITISVEVPGNWLKKGLNIIQMGMVSGSWAVFDDIRMEGNQDLQIQDASSSLILSAKAAPFELKKDNKRIQPLLIDVIQMDKEESINVSVGGLPPVTKNIEKGHAVIEIPMPAVAKNKQGFNSVVTIKKVIKLYILEM
ncbi:polysaccharide lyase family protein [Pedobacter steynii]